MIKDMLGMLMMIILIIMSVFMYFQMDAQRKQLQHIQQAWVDANEITNEALEYYSHKEKELFDHELVLEKIKDKHLDVAVNDDVKQLLAVQVTHSH